MIEVKGRTISLPDGYVFVGYSENKEDERCYIRFTKGSSVTDFRLSKSAAESLLVLLADPTHGTRIGYNIEENGSRWVWRQQVQTGGDLEETEGVDHFLQEPCDGNTSPEA